MLKKIYAVLTFLLLCHMPNVQAQQLEVGPNNGRTIERNARQQTQSNITLEENERWMGYWNGDTSDIVSLGAQRTPMEYRAAIGYMAGNHEIAGKTITGIRFLLSSSTKLDLGKVWISTDLNHTSEKADICYQEVAQLGEVNEVRFSHPYCVDSAKNVYVGYSFKVTGGRTESDKFPILCSTAKDEDGGFWMQMGGERQQWKNYHEQGLGVLAMQILVSGEIAENNVKITSEFGDLVSTQLGCTLPLTFENIGVRKVETLSIQTKVGGVETVKEIVVSEEKNAPGQQFSTEIQLDVPQQSGRYDYQVKVVGVNGVAMTADVAGAGKICVVSKTVPHKVFVEEFTGMWCGHCPRGMVALEKLRQLYGENIVLVAAHANDKLECRDYSGLIQQTVGGYPAAHVDRSLQGIDPYWGLGTSFGINDCVKAAAAIVPVAEVTAIPVLKGDTLSATAKVEFLYSDDEANYAVGYVVTENGMRNRTWVQTNYLSGDQSYAKEDPLFVPWVQAGPKRPNVVFDDVAIAARGIEKGIENSIPLEVKDGEEIFHTIKFPLKRYPKIMDRSQLNLGVVLFDTRTGRVVNADMKLVGSSTGLDEIAADKSGVVAYYTVDGRQLHQPQRGMNIVKYADGSVKKVMMK